MHVSEYVGVQEGFLQLTAALLTQTRVDFEQAYVQLAKGKKVAKSLETVEEIEAFVLHGSYELFTDMDPARFLRLLRLHALQAVQRVYLETYQAQADIQEIEAFLHTEVFARLSQQPGEALVLRWRRIAETGGAEIMEKRRERPVTHRRRRA